MPSLDLFSIMKNIAPAAIRRTIRKILNYISRIRIWTIILWQVRGVAWNDRIALYVSAIVSPYYALFKLLEWQDPVLLFDASVRVKGVGIFCVRKKSDDLYHVTPWREKAVFKSISNVLKNGDVFIDAGANIGFYSILASRLVGNGGRVVCFEMMPDTAVQLEENVRINNISNITIIKKALSDSEGQEIIARVEPGRFGRASISALHPEAVTIGVITTTLDQACANIGSIKLMKMDIEGSEFKALLGARVLLDRIDSVIYEKWGSMDTSEDRVAELLSAHAFELHQIDANNYLASKTVNE